MAKKKTKKKAVDKNPADNNKGGQPTKYRYEMCQGVIDFFDVSPWIVVDGKRQYQRMPSLIGYAKSINVCYNTIYNWIDEKHDSFQAEFLQSYNKAKKCRKQWLIDVGLSGLAPANSFKFVAVNCTDMTDKRTEVHNLDKDTISLLGLIDGSTKGKLPTKQEEQDAR